MFNINLFNDKRARPLNNETLSEKERVDNEKFRNANLYAPVNIYNQVLKFQNMVGAGGVGKVYHYVPTKNTEPGESFVIKQADTAAANRQYRNLNYLKRKNMCDFFLCPKGYFFHPQIRDRRYIKLEYLTGYETLTDCYEKQRFIYKRDWDILKTKMVNIIQQLHQNGTVHCDIKPENIMIEINEDGFMTQNVKFIDVGSLLHMEDAYKIEKSSYTKKSYYNYLKFDTFTPLYLDFQIFLPYLFKKWNETNRILYMDVTPLFGGYTASNLNNVSITKNNVSYSYKKTDYSIDLNFYYKDPIQSVDTRNVLIDLLLKKIYIINYFTYENGMTMKYNYFSKNGTFINPRPIFYCIFDEFYDFERFKMNDMNAMKLTNVFVEYMLNMNNLIK